MRRYEIGPKDTRCKCLRRNFHSEIFLGTWKSNRSAQVLRHWFYISAIPNRCFGIDYQSYPVAQILDTSPCHNTRECIQKHMG
jgi:hypothetical protein